MSDPYRVLILDANLAHRLAVVLINKRRRWAFSARQLDLEGREDPVILRYMRMYWPLAVLVTADDNMPREHADLFTRWEPTVAIVDPRSPLEYRGDDSWHWEIVQRWCHRMQVQPQGSVYPYNASGGRAWVRPRRIARPATIDAVREAPPGEDLEAMLQEVDLESDPEAGIQSHLFEEE